MEQARLAADPALTWAILLAQCACELIYFKKVEHELDKKHILRRN